MICCLCVSCMLLSILESISEANWSFSAAYRSFAAMANVVFVDIIALFNYGRRAKRVFLTVLCIWSTMYERILNSFSDILLTMTALWFRSLVRSFLKIAADPTSPPDKVSRRLSSDHLLRLIWILCTGNTKLWTSEVFGRAREQRNCAHHWEFCDW